MRKNLRRGKRRQMIQEEMRVEIMIRHRINKRKKKIRRILNQRKRRGMVN